MTAILKLMYAFTETEIPFQPGYLHERLFNKPDLINLNVSCNCRRFFNYENFMKNAYFHTIYML